MNKNLQKAIEVMFGYSDQGTPRNNMLSMDDNYLTREIEKIVKKKDWYQKYTWTQRHRDMYFEWFEENLKKNWEGITTYKPTNKKARQKASDEFDLCYGFPIRKMTIEDFNQLVPVGQMEERMSKKEFDDCMDWLRGQTCSLHGIYRYDLERYLNGLPNND